MSRESLFDLVGALSTDYGFERSVKLSHGELINDRYLLSVHKDAFGEQPFNTLSVLLQRLDMPEACFPEVETELTGADVVHLGLEGQSDVIIYKLYLEYASKFKMAMRHSDSITSPQLVHLAFKWSPLDSTKQVKTYYDCQPYLSESAIIQQIQTAYANKVSGMPCQVVTAIFKHALEKTDCRDLMFMEVHEDNNQRLSFDLNLYNAEVMVSDVVEPLRQASDYFAIPKEHWSRFMDDASAEVLGHISGGIGRDGNEFLTVYFGVVGMSSREQAGRLPL